MTIEGERPGETGSQSGTAEAASELLDHVRLQSGPGTMYRYRQEVLLLSDGNHATGFEPDGHREGGVAQSRWRLRSARTTRAVAP